MVHSSFRDRLQALLLTHEACKVHTAALVLPYYRHFAVLSEVCLFETGGARKQQDTSNAPDITLNKCLNKQICFSRSG